MKTFLKIITITLICLGITNLMSEATTLDCTKVCYQAGTISTGGAVCFGGAGAADFPATVRISDNKGGTITGSVNADGSFMINCSSLNAGLGDKVTITVDDKKCNVVAQKECYNAAGSDSWGDGLDDDYSGLGSGNNPTPPTGGSSLGGGATGSSTNYQNNGNSSGNNMNCSKICFEIGSTHTGGGFAIGQRHAVPPNASLTIIDPSGNTATGKATPSGAFRIPCANLTVQNGQTITIKVGDSFCKVTAVRSCQ